MWYVEIQMKFMCLCLLYLYSTTICSIDDLLPTIVANYIVYYTFLGESFHFGVKSIQWAECILEC